MITDTKARELGFIDFEEMLLYQDICGDGLYLAELFEEENLEEIGKEFTKKDYEKYIKSHGLVELFNKVKGLPLLDRMIEIYIYYANGFSLSKEAEKIFSFHLQEAKELYDGEKEKEYLKQIDRARNMKGELFRKMHYIESEVMLRLPSEEVKFYNAIKEVSSALLDKKDDSKNNNVSFSSK